MNNNYLKRFLFNSLRSFRRSRSYSSRKYPNAVKLAYHVHDVEQTGSWEIGSLGNNDDTPLLVLHGLFGCRANWHTVAKKLADSGRRVITVDSRNHGDSEHNPHMDYYCMRDDIFRLMDDLHLNKVILVGHSMGGKTAMSVALTEPDRLKALAVVDVAPETSPGGTLLLSYAQRMREIVPDPSAKVSKARKDAEVQMRPVVDSPLVRHFLLTNLVEREGRLQWRLNLDAIIENYYNILDFPEFTHPFTKPTIFIGGSLSHHITPEKMPEINRLFPAGEVTHVPGVGHWVHSENPPEFITILSGFLDSLS